jgi:hypothetical protein
VEFLASELVERLLVSTWETMIVWLQTKRPKHHRPQVEKWDLHIPLFPPPITSSKSCAHSGKDSNLIFPIHTNYNTLHGQNPNDLSHHLKGRVALGFLRKTALSCYSSFLRTWQLTREFQHINNFDNSYFMIDHLGGYFDWEPFGRCLITAMNNEIHRSTIKTITRRAIVK